MRWTDFQFGIAVLNQQQGHEGHQVKTNSRIINLHTSNAQ